MGSLIPNTAGISKIVLGILATGALLNLAGTGKLGASAQKLARYITNGYGVN